MVGDFNVISTPGHAGGHSSYFRESDGLLIVGDVLTNMSFLTTSSGLHLPPAIFTKNQTENINSLKKLIDLGARIWCFGHGPILFNNDKQVEKFYAKVQNEYNSFSFSS